ncbi:MAG TPA: glycosyltransferase family 87 protein [Nitrospira sp.]|nr:glycosyltransferase family 87 protein [Nitrospira sp.]
MAETSVSLRTLNAVSWLAIVIYILWFTTSFQIRHHSLEPDRLLDYALNYNQSRLVAAELSYPSRSQGFLYPPANVVLRLALGRLGLQSSAVVWMVLLIGATLLCVESSLYLLGLSKHPVRYFMALLALSSVEYFFEWDLKYLNGNVLYLACLLTALILIQKTQVQGAASLLAFSLVLKLYSAVFLPYFFLKKQYRLCFATGLWLVLFFLALPIGYFGVGNAWTVTEHWVRSLLDSGDSTFPLEFPAYLTGLHKTLLILLTSTGGNGRYNIADLSYETVWAVTRTFQSVWVAAVMMYFIRARHCSANVPLGTRQMIDAGVLSLLVLPLSPVVQPHHGVVMFIPAMVLIRVLFDASVAPAFRTSAGAILSACYVELQFGPRIQLRGIGMMTCVMILMSGLILAFGALSRLPADARGKEAVS